MISDEIHSASFAFDPQTGLSWAALSARPNTDPTLRGLCRLSQNGVESWRFEDTLASLETWRLRGATVELRGDVTGTDWSVFRVTYPSAG